MNEDGSSRDTDVGLVPSAEAHLTGARADDDGGGVEECPVFGIFSGDGKTVHVDDSICRPGAAYRVAEPLLFRSLPRYSAKSIDLARGKP